MLNKYISNRNYFSFSLILSWLANVSILGIKREPVVGKLGCHGHFDTGFERNYFVQDPVCGFFELNKINCIEIRNFQESDLT